jgi:endonuclease G
LTFANFFGPPLAAQEVDELIRARQQELDAYKEQFDHLLKDLERLKLQKIIQTLKKHLPEPLVDEEIVEHSAMILSYNEEHEQANWVMHMVTKDILYGTTGRTNDFRPDPKVSTGTADSVDYWNSGYDRGHLAPSADFRWSRDALSESYYYSNMSPQVPEMNRGAWAKLENQVREWAVDNDEVIVFTGPVLKPELPKVQQGSFRLSIPEAYYKIVVDLNDSIPHKAIAFLFPNKDVTYDIQRYVVTIDSVEKVTGINFFPSLQDAEILESRSELKEWSISNAAISKAPFIRYDADHIPAPQALYFINKECNVCGKVVGTRYNKNTETGITYLNFDKPYPDSPFTVVIFGKDRINFTYEPEVYLKNKVICVRGKVQLYKGKPQIVADRQAQVSLYQPVE